MALTDVYYSPSGAGSQDGSSAANAKAALTGTSWTTAIEGETPEEGIVLQIRTPRGNAVILLKKEV